MPICNFIAAVETESKLYAVPQIVFGNEPLQPKTMVFIVQRARDHELRSRVDVSHRLDQKMLPLFQRPTRPPAKK